MSRSLSSLISKPPTALTELLETEKRWRERYEFLVSKGYQLRPRLRPGWKPSWEDTGKNILDCEDAIILPARSNLVDAMKADGTLVYIKRVETDDLESHLATMLSTPELLKDPHNHCVPILETFQDDVDESVSYMVMPFLKLMDEPSFEYVAEVIDCVTQLLEGLVFIHKHGVAHRDCSRKNLMMDASAMYPRGFHPVKQLFLPDAVTPVWPLSRMRAKTVKYYYVDFGISVYIPPGERPLVTGSLGRDREPPELRSESEMYDPFKLDVFIIGNVFRREFYDNYTNVGFLIPLFTPMVSEDPLARPDASAALNQWYKIKETISSWTCQSRLRPRDEPIADNIVLSTVSFIKWAFGVA